MKEFLDEACAPPALTLPETRHTAPLPPSQPYHFLIVDDDPITRELISDVIVSKFPSATCFTASNGAEGLARFSERAADLVITDHHMPVMFGLHFIRALRAQQVNIPVIALSADTEAGSELMAAGASRFLPKPFRLQQVRDLLVELLAPSSGVQND